MRPALGALLLPSCVSLATVVALAPLPAVAAVDNHLTLTSAATPEVPGNGSFSRAISDDGRFVVFASHQPNVVPAEPGDVGRYVYLRDVASGTTTRLSHGTEGYLMGNAAISGNGRLVVFANKEGPFDQTGLRLVNTRTGKVRVIARSSTPGSEVVDWYTVGISDDGRWVVYTRTASTDGGTTWTTELFRYDTVNRTTDQPITGALGGPPDRPNYATVPSVSGNGQYVALVRAVTPGSGSTPYELVRLDTISGERRVLATSGPEYLPGDAFGEPTISNSGRFVAATRLDAGRTPHVHLHDLKKGTSRLVDHTSTGTPSTSGGYQPAVSGDGGHVVFVSSATDLVPDTSGAPQVYVWDRVADSFEAVVRNRQGRYPGSGNAAMPYVDGDGSTVAFTSTALSLAPDLTTRLERVYTWER